MTAYHIRRSRPADCAPLIALWERSVRATHGFLTEADIACYRPLVAELLAGDSLELWVLMDTPNVPLGFLGLSAHAIEALFLEPSVRRQGCGRRLVAHAQQLRAGALTVDVNEENHAARRFYEALGFVVIGRSPLDETARSHPLLHMRREAPEVASEIPSEPLGPIEELECFGLQPPGVYAGRETLVVRESAI